jgi:F-type H+-transporting ATPase subunit b
MQIDWWTLALQTINVVILVWLLGHFFFKPVMAIVAERQAVAAKALADADAARRAVADAHQEADEIRAAIAKERESLIAEAKKTAKTEQDALVARANSHLAEMHAKAEEDLARQRAAAEDALVARASDLSVAIARRLLGRLPPEVTFDAFVRELCGEIQRLPEDKRQILATERLVVVTPEPLDEDQRDRLQAALDAALGAALQITFSSDATLIAGIDLRGRAVVITNSWKNDLAKINEELKRDGGQSGASGELA